MLQVLLLGFNNLDLNKFILLQSEDKNGFMAGTPKASVYFTHSFIFLHLFSMHLAWDGGLQAACGVLWHHSGLLLIRGNTCSQTPQQWGSMCVQVSLCLSVISEWVRVNEWMVGACMCACVFWCGCWPVPWSLGGLDLPLIGRHGCQVVLGHQFLTRTRQTNLYQGQLPAASGLLGLSPFGREHPIWGLPSSPAGMGVRDVWPQVFYQKPEINFQVFTALPAYEVCQWCLTVIFTVFSLVGNMPGWSCITTFTYAATALSPEQLKKAQHEH